MPKNVCLENNIRSQAWKLDLPSQESLIVTCCLDRAASSIGLMTYQCCCVTELSKQAASLMLLESSEQPLKLTERQQPARAQLSIL